MTKKAKMKNKRTVYLQTKARGERLMESRLRPEVILRQQKANITAFRRASTKGDVRSMEKYEKRILQSIESRKTLSKEDKSFVLGSLATELKFKGIESKLLNAKIQKLSEDPLAYIEAIAQKLKKEQSEENKNIIDALKLQSEESLKEYYEKNMEEVGQGSNAVSNKFFKLVDALNQL